MKTKLLAVLFPLFVFAGASLAADAITLGKTVVVLVGLPGDLESEKRYDDQLKTLLEIFTLATAKPKRVIVLADEPQRVTLPSGMAGEVKANSRDNFLALASVAQ